MKNYNRPVFLLFLIFVCSIRLHAQQPTLLDAVKNNDIKQVKLLLDKGENPNAKVEKVCLNPLNLISNPIT